MPPEEDGQPAQRRPRSTSSAAGSSKGPSTPSTGPSSRPRRRRCPRSSDAAWPRNGIDFWILAPAGARGAEALARGRPLHAPAPRQPRPARPAADARGGRRVRPRHGARRLRAGRRPLPRRPRLRRALGADVARPGPLRRLGRLRLRPAAANIWRYRDWVIDAFNRNLPYDRFTLEQIAGDLLPEPDASSRRIATAFHRNTMTNTEGGTDDEEFRVAADQGPGRHHDAGLDGADDGLRQVPQPQVRPDHAGGVLPVLRHLQPDGRQRPARRAARSIPRPDARRSAASRASRATSSRRAGSPRQVKASELAGTRRAKASEGVLAARTAATRPAEALRSIAGRTDRPRSPRWRSRGRRSRPCR